MGGSDQDLHRSGWEWDDASAAVWAVMIGNPAGAGGCRIQKTQISFSFSEFITKRVYVKKTDKYERPLPSKGFSNAGGEVKRQCEM